MVDLIIGNRYDITILRGGVWDILYDLEYRDDGFYDRINWRVTPTVMVGDWRPTTGLINSSGKFI